MDRSSLGIRDLDLHVVKFGVDVYPTIEVAAERTHLNIFYEEASRRWPELYEELLSSNTQFEIAKRFGSAGAPGSAKGQTFVLTPRGPVFLFPLFLPPPIGATGLEGDCLDKLADVRKLFFSSLPGRKCLRIGLCRELVFATGQDSWNELLTDKTEFANAQFVGGESLLAYRDAKCNVRVRLQPIEIARMRRLPVGTQIAEKAGRGLRVELDVNNADVRPLEDADMEEILTRATGLWPDALLDYLSGGRTA